MSWRLLMGSCALALTFSALVLGQFVPGQHGPGSLHLAAQQTSSTRSAGGAHGVSRGGGVVGATPTTSTVPASGSSGSTGTSRKDGGTGPAGVTSGASTWSPQPAVYGTGSVLDQSVTMSDGTVLKADVYFPTVAGTTTAAAGHFPALLQQTPYGKAFIVYAAAIAQTDVKYLVDRGYIVV
ncbi:MAG TPA: CocE/NonD family hydrolase, partial [Acidimicrobiales bacterium]|nr:CocE/NonD family hydrolase [Acidimicrobiales bacterium]